MTTALTGGARGGGVTLLGQAIRIGVQFAALVILSRLLSPADFGLIAMVTVFVALGELIRDFGTTIIGMQRQQLTAQAATNLFWMSTLLGLGAGTLLAAATPLVVAFYDEPRLESIVPALAIAVALNGMSAQFQVQLARSRRYSRLAVADTIAPTLGFVVAIALALAGAGFLALVWQSLTTAAVALALRALWAGWWPGWPKRDHENGGLMRDSALFGSAQLLTYVSQNVDNAVIGARWDAADLGGYSRAYQLLTAPLNSMMGPLTQVVVPTVNRARAEGQEAWTVLLKVQFALGYALIWLYAVTAGVASWFVPLTLGAQWYESVPIFQILAIGGCFWALSRVSYWGFVVNNLGHSLLSYNLITKSFSTLLIIGAAFVSIDAVAWAVTIGLAISWPFNLWWLARRGAQPFLPFLLNGLGILLLGLIAAAVAGVLMHALPGPEAVVGVASVAGASATYVGLTLISPRWRDQFLATIHLARRAFRKR